jgi:hypothetical protein
LQLIAAELGLDLEPRAVSLVATQLSTGDKAIMGPKALAMVPDGQRHLMERVSAWDVENGHMVLTSEDPRTFFDPNLRQLNGYGIPASNIAMNIQSTNPLDGGWTANLPDLQVVYLVDDDNTRLRSAYEEGLAEHQANAKAIARMLQDGLSVDQINARLGRH